MSNKTYLLSLTQGEELELGAADAVKSVAQCVKLILSTPKGTVPMYRDFGVDLSFLDLPTPAAEQRARIEIREAVERWEPRVEVKDITFSVQEGKLIPTVEIEVQDE